MSDQQLRPARFPRAVRRRVALMCVIPLLPIVPLPLLIPFGFWAVVASVLITTFACAAVTGLMLRKLHHRIASHEFALCTQCMHPLVDSEGCCPGCGGAYRLVEEMRDWMRFSLNW
jgi:hypothetical protein